MRTLHLEQIDPILETIMPLNRIALGEAEQVTEKLMATRGLSTIHEVYWYPETVAHGMLGQHKYKTIDKVERMSWILNEPTIPSLSWSFLHNNMRGAGVETMKIPIEKWRTEMFKTLQISVRHVHRIEESITHFLRNTYNASWRNDTPRRDFAWIPSEAQHGNLNHQESVFINAPFRLYIPNLDSDIQSYNLVLGQNFDLFNGRFKPNQILSL